MSSRHCCARWNSRNCGTGSRSGTWSSAIPGAAASASFNVPITVADKTFQVDCHWPGTNQIVELDGWQAHKSRSAFREDKARDRRLVTAGYTVTHLTWNQLDDEPEAIASDLRVLLGIDR
jgi:very-short-patch-repair endonuclease